MTIFDLVEALKRYWKAIAVALSVLVVLVVAMTFQIRDGRLAFRARLTYESTVQIAVVTPGTDNVRSISGGSQRHVDAARLYASLLQSDEAARWIGEENGFQPEELVDASTGRDNAVITARVTGPTEEQAIGAALSTIDWLNKKLQEPVATTPLSSPSTTLPLVVLDGPFSSFVDVQLGDGLSDISDELFLFVDVGDVSQFGVSLPQSAGSTARTRAILEPLTTVILTLRTPADEVLDTIRLAPDPLPQVVGTVPELGISLADDSIGPRTISVDDTIGTGDTAEVAQITWGFNASAISLEWLEGTTSVVAPSAAVADVELALLTPEPGSTSSGGRRGPIVAVAALIVGAVLVMATVVVVDTWRNERDAHIVSEIRLPVSLETSPSEAARSREGNDEERLAEIQIQAKSRDS